MCVATMSGPCLGPATIPNKRYFGFVTYSRPKCIESDNHVRPKQLEFDNHASKSVLGLATMFGSDMTARSKRLVFDIQKKMHESGMVVELRHLDKKIKLKK
jgi:hypothetical protein